MTPSARMLRGAALIAAFSGGCSDQRTNIVLITLDTTRADRIGAAGDQTAMTPHLDGLAARGVLFERAYASSPLTLPSHTTILTGVEPHRHGVHDNGLFILPDEAETVAERLEAAGYATGAFVAAFVLDAEFGLAQGFDVYDDVALDVLTPLSHEIPSRRGALVTDNALAWLARVTRRPFFLWVHYYDVHVPRAPPPPFDTIADPYAGELAYVDREVGRVLDAIAARDDAERTLIIVTADHGESLGDHGELTHGIVAYDSTLHVPLIVAGRGFERGRRVSSFATTADVVPTALAASGIPIPPGLDGKPLQATLSESAPVAGEDEVAYFEAVAAHHGYGWAAIRGVRTPRWKYTAEPIPLELFDMEADPDEMRNLADERRDVIAALDEAYRAEQSRALTGEIGTRLVRPSPDVVEKLEALGYLSAPSDIALPADRWDPRLLVNAPPLIDTAGFLARNGRIADSIEALEILATSPPARTLALRRLAPIYLVAGRYERAMEVFETLRPLVGGGVDLGVATALIALGRSDEALERLLGAQQSAASSQAQILRAQLLLALDRADEAETISVELSRHYPESDAAIALAAAIRAAREGAAAVVPSLVRKLDRVKGEDWPRTRLLLGELLHELGRDREAMEMIGAMKRPTAREYLLLAAIAASRANHAEAIANYEKAAADWPAAMEIRRTLADAYADVGRFADALTSYDLVLSANPDDVATAVDRAVVLARLGRKDEAERIYRDAIDRSAELPEAYLNLALLELERGDDIEAEAHLLRAVELRPDFQKAHAHLAMLYGSRGDPRASKHADLSVLGPTAATNGSDGFPQARVTLLSDP